MRPLVVASLLAAGCLQHPPNDGRTAVELEQSAQRHQSAAASARALSERQQAILAPPTGPEQFGEVGSPLELAPAGRVVIEEQRARTELEAAHRLREAANGACGRLSESERLTCPTGGPTARVDDVELGVRIAVPPSEAEILGTQLDCALARSRVERPPDWDRCPLFVPGAAARVVRSPGSAALEIVSDDAVRASEIRRRAHSAR